MLMTRCALYFSMDFHDPRTPVMPFASSEIYEMTTAFVE